jgi:hypothetical protein
VRIPQDKTGSQITNTVTCESFNRKLTDICYGMAGLSIPGNPAEPGQAPDDIDDIGPIIDHARESG